MNTKISDSKLQITFLVNTPYHLYITFIITNILQSLNPRNEFELIVVGNHLGSESDRLYKSSDAWRATYQLDDAKAIGNDMRALIQTAKTIRQTRVFCNHYFKNSRLTHFVSYVDHHPVNATILGIFKKKCKGKFVLIEEGSSAYLSLEPMFKSTKMRKLLRSSIKRLLGIGNPDSKPVGTVGMPDRCIVSDMKSLRYGYGDGSKMFEWPSGPFPRALTAQYMGMIGKNSIISALPKDAIVYLSQPLSEDGLMELEVEKKYIELLSDLSKKNGIKIVVKPHPRESAEKIQFYKQTGLYLDPALSSIPAEVMFAFYEPQAVISPFSSAAINYATRFNGKVIWLEGLMLGSDKMSKSFWQNYSGDVCIPRNHDDLFEAIKAVKGVRSHGLDEKDWTGIVARVFYDSDELML